MPIREIIVNCFNTDYTNLALLVADYPRDEVLRTMAEMLEVSSEDANCILLQWKKNAGLPAAW